MLENRALIHELNDFLKTEVKRHRQRPWLNVAKISAIGVLALGAGFFSLLTVSAFSAADHQFSLNINNAQPPNLPQTLGQVTAAAWQIATASTAKLAGEDRGRINILFLGMAGEPNPSPYLTDTMLIASIETSSGKVAITSVPRDLYVKAPFAPYGARINSFYQYGLLNNSPDPEDLAISKTEQITGQKIDYWGALDLSAVVKIVDALGGIDIYVPEDLDDETFPGPNFSFAPFKIKAGFQHVDGTTAAKYARSRHTTNGDFDRINRQREVIEAVATKIKALNPVWNFPELLGIYQSLQGHFSTNLAPGDIKRLVDLLKNTDGKQVYGATISADPEIGLLKEENYYGAAVLIPKEGYEQYNKIKEFFKNVFSKF